MSEYAFAWLMCIVVLFFGVLGLVLVFNIEQSERKAFYAIHHCVEFDDRAYVCKDGAVRR